ncbi:hypothetical protein [Salibacter sp.]|uniref:hypothetical protein n=1 Tax=Salibacter sp. TaxID=2010995 RepID=UPI00286FBBA7|nr:hypothetical protein [Salibacter sp.]MDR9399308.1 hypothetical protein [Salibacter sp.]MDR9487758.1 hypothetical protein [Salibacter sp.]
MIELTSSNNVILPKHIVDDVFEGSLHSFICQFENVDEDKYLITIRTKYAAGVDKITRKLAEMGFSFDEASNKSGQFTVFAKEGIWWEVPWLVEKNGDVWFIADVEAPI